MRPTLFLAFVTFGCTSFGGASNEGTDASSPLPSASTTASTSPDGGTILPSPPPPPPAPAKLIFVHAGNYLGAPFESSTGDAAKNNGAIRLCFATGEPGAEQVAPMAPFPSDAISPASVAGFVPGSGGALPLRTDLSKTQLSLVAINSQALADRIAKASGAERTMLQNAKCPELLAPTLSGGALVEQTDYHTWPGGKANLPARIVRKVSRDVDATATMWATFWVAGSNRSPMRAGAFFRVCPFTRTNVQKA